MYEHILWCDNAPSGLNGLKLGLIYEIVYLKSFVAVLPVEIFLTQSYFFKQYFKWLYDGSTGPHIFRSNPVSAQESIIKNVIISSNKNGKYSLLYRVVKKGFTFWFHLYVSHLRNVIATFKSIYY